MLRLLQISPNEILIDLYEKAIFSFNSFTAVGGAGTGEGNPDPGYSLQEGLRTGNLETEGGNDDTASPNEVVFTTENDQASTSLDKSQGSSQPFLLAIPII